MCGIRLQQQVETPKETPVRNTKIPAESSGIELRDVKPDLFYKIADIEYPKPWESNSHWSQIDMSNVPDDASLLDELGEFETAAVVKGSDIPEKFKTDFWDELRAFEVSPPPSFLRSVDYNRVQPDKIYKILDTSRGFTEDNGWLQAPLSEKIHGAFIYIEYHGSFETAATMYGREIPEYILEDFWSELRYYEVGSEPASPGITLGEIKKMILTIAYRRRKPSFTMSILEDVRVIGVDFHTTGIEWADDKFTVASIKVDVNGETIESVGVAARNPNDEHNEFVGRRLALYRAASSFVFTLL